MDAPRIRLRGLYEADRLEIRKRVGAALQRFHLHTFYVDLDKIDAR